MTLIRHAVAAFLASQVTIRTNSDRLGVSFSAAPEDHITHPVVALLKLLQALELPDATITDLPTVLAVFRNWTIKHMDDPDSIHEVLDGVREFTDWTYGQGVTSRNLSSLLNKQVPATVHPLRPKGGRHEQ